jgi:hypothetical protein
MVQGQAVRPTLYVYIVDTVYSWLYVWMNEEICMNNLESVDIQDILWSAFTMVIAECQNLEMYT